MQSPHLLGERVELKWGVNHQDHARGALTDKGNVRCDGCGDVFGRAKFERHRWVLPGVQAVLADPYGDSQIPDSYIPAASHR